MNNMIYSSTINTKVCSIIFSLLLILNCSCNSDKTGKQTQNEIESAPVTLSNWEDTLAYALGVRYRQEKSTGYSRPLKEYLEWNMIRIYGIDTFSEHFQNISQKGMTDAEKGNSILPLPFVGTFLNLVDCENRILEYEKEIPIEKEEITAFRMSILMNNTYKRIQFILRDQPSFTYSFKRIENYMHKRDSILALPPEMFILPSTSNSSITSQSEVVKKSIGSWSLKDSHYDSHIIKEEYDGQNNVRFILSKGKIEVVFSEIIEAEYEMKLIVNGSEHTIIGSRHGKTFAISSSNEISTILAVLDRGNFTFQYMFLDPGASHWGWSDYKITSQLKQASEAYSAINSK